jgi:anti-sigma-K factor RskA
VNKRGSTTDHREYEEMLAAGALGALTREEHRALTEHLRGCATCRSAFGRLLSTSDTLPFTAEERAPSSALRERLRSRVQGGSEAGNLDLPASRPDEPIPLRVEPIDLSDPRRRRGPGRTVWLVAAAAMLLLGLLGGVLIDRMLLDTDDPVSTRELALQSPTGMELGRAQLVYLPEEGIVRFSAPDLPPPPDDRVYQVWLIAGDDEAPTPVGVIDPVTGEFATAADTQRYAVFAVTVEPGPLGSTAPTTTPVIVADLPEPSTT